MYRKVIVHPGIDLLDAHYVLSHYRQYHDQKDKVDKIGTASGVYYTLAYGTYWVYKTSTAYVIRMTKP